MEKAKWRKAGGGWQREEVMGSGKEGSGRGYFSLTHLKMLF